MARVRGNQSKRNGNCQQQNRQRGSKGAPFTNVNKANTRDRAQRRFEEMDDDMAKQSRTNDVSWYTKNAQFAKDAATLPFSTPLGQLTHWELGDGSIAWAPPGIMRILFTPAIGVSTDYSSPINRSSIRFWTYLRSIQKASGDYDHQDITMMMLAIDSCIIFHSMLRRLYGVLRNITPMNEYYPRALVAAMGFVFDDVVSNISNLRAYINEFAYQLTQYALPKNVALFERHRWMCEGLYADSVSTRAQTYMFVPHCFWQYDNTVETGSQLVFKQWIGVQNTKAQYTLAETMAFGNELINAISNDSDFGTISGDMYTFYKGDTFKLDYTGEDYQILPVYNETVLSQIENATIMGFFAENPVISQNPGINAGAILFNPKLAVQFSHEQGAHMNFHWDSPTPDQVLEASRLICQLLKRPGATDGIDYLETCGTEIVNKIDVFARNPATNKFRSNELSVRMLAVSTSTPGAEVIALLQDVVNLQAFDWAPRLELLQMTPEGNATHFLGTTWDVDNLSVVPTQYLKNLNTAALMSLFDV